jgi:hypothetical protein
MIDDRAGDEIRTSDIQLGRNVLGFVFGFSGNRRLSAFIQVFAIRRGFLVVGMPSQSGPAASEALMASVGGPPSRRIPAR